MKEVFSAESRVSSQRYHPRSTAGYKMPCPMLTIDIFWKAAILATRRRQQDSRFRVIDSLHVRIGMLRIAARRGNAVSGNSHICVVKFAGQRLSCNRVVVGSVKEPCKKWIKQDRLLHFGIAYSRRWTDRPAMLFCRLHPFIVE